MKNSFATMILAAATMMPVVPFAVAHGDGGAAHGATFTRASYAPAQPMPSFDSASVAQPADNGPSSTIAWLMAVGFLGAVIVRRTRSPL